MGFFRKHLGAIILLLVGAALLTGGYFLLRSHTNAVARDFQRLADMHAFRSAFERMYQDEASYEAAMCDEEELAHFCLLSEYDPDVMLRKDPSEFAYTVTTAPNDTSYGITFTLERSYGDLSAGEHTLSESGIK